MRLVLFIWIRISTFAQDGVVSEGELVNAVLRTEHLTTMVADKMMVRFYCSCHKISRG